MLELSLVQVAVDFHALRFAQAAGNTAAAALVPFS
jgi:hypothetical protein